ncbi:hypothetical protein GTO91_05665 [Heliobacterium undosum]|uniref:Uncharacterized protein n=1 Tax=Heliomicrobium undosum TaxID=121734 RepID=A0A845L2X2_9FIRM|nr:hypothetical protein [Heliomicrobium undosum]MZP29194.1 hypothetical protein [Heliomicrobium undosum]
MKRDERTNKREARKAFLQLVRLKRDEALRFMALGDVDNAVKTSREADLLWEQYLATTAKRASRRGDSAQASGGLYEASSLLDA